MIGKIDTGSEVSLINRNSLLQKLKLNKINKVFGQLKFASSNSNIQRFGITDPLKTVYLNGITFDHAYDVPEFNDSMEFDVLLGTDILPKMNISLTGVAVKWDDVQILEEDEKFKNINFMEIKNEPNKSPYGTSSQYKSVELNTLVHEATDV